MQQVLLFNKKLENIKTVLANYRARMHVYLYMVSHVGTAVFTLAWSILSLIT